MIKIGLRKHIHCKYKEKISTLGYKLKKNFFKCTAKKKIVTDSCCGGLEML